MIAKDSVKNRNYWRGFDYVKGILIILVFLGHVIPGVHREIYPRYIIYSFHMPLFIGVSGFLLNIEQLNIKIFPLFKKYWKRMICPWIIAVTVFFISGQIVGKQPFNIKNLINAYIMPYYHLWYVLGFLSYLVTACTLWIVFRKNKYRWIWIFSISAIISFVSEWQVLSVLLGSDVFNSIYESIHNDFRMFHFLFFIIGIYLRYKYEHKGIIYSSNKMECIRLLSIISVICVAILFFFDYPNFEKIMFFIMNTFLLIVVIFDSVNQKVSESKLIEFLGKYSLPIYLYHIMCKLLAQYIFAEGTIGYYSISIVSFIIGCISIYYLKNVRFFNTVIFGSTTSSLNSK